VLQNATVNQTIDELLDWAAKEVKNNADAIQDNLAKTSSNHFNLLWPGSGYSAVSCGGQFQVLSILEKQGILKTGIIVGASGGATSGILALSDTSRSSRSLLFYYHVMELYKRTTHDKELLAQGAYLQYLYEHAIIGEESFANVKSTYRAMAACSKRFLMMGTANTGFYNCETRRQCGQATLASGEATAKGITGDDIDGMYDQVGRCRDGGSVRGPPSDANYEIYFDSNYGMDYVTWITTESIKLLFKNGVADTISLLKSPDLRILKSDSQSVRAEVRAPESSSEGTCTQWYDMVTKDREVTPSNCLS